MTERSPFDRHKFVAMASYVARRSPTSAHLAVTMWMADMEAVRKLGAPITGATYCKGRVLPYVRETGEGETFLRRFWLSQFGPLERTLAYGLTAWIVIRCRAWRRPSRPRATSAGATPRSAMPRSS